jgi:murein DD-endopeptidase MepM/ murein hydrolase activator NlpD
LAVNRLRSLAVMLAAWPAIASAQPAVGQMQLPVRPACMSSPFGDRPAPGPHAIGFHRGIDIPAPAGAAIYAVADGHVSSIHRRGPGGLEIAISHQGAAGPYVSLYAHLGLIAPAFASGRSVVHAGDRIGVVGRSGVIYGTHLYFELLVGGIPVDPAPYFGMIACPKKTTGNAREP